MEDVDIFNCRLKHLILLLRDIKKVKGYLESVFCIVQGLLKLARFKSALGFVVRLVTVFFMPVCLKINSR